VDDPAARERVAGARVARLATIDPDGRAHLVPIVFVLDGDTLYTAVDAKPKRSRRLRRIENARERPDVTVLVDHYDEDWQWLWWVLLRGRARVLDEGEEAQRGIRAAGRAGARRRRRRMARVERLTTHGRGAPT
jgi:PPOX class probable F420-dependent enzyme